MKTVRNPVLSSSDFFRDCEDIVTLVFRQDFTQAGFAVWVLPEKFDSHALRRCMVILKEHLSHRHSQRWDEPLEYLSLGRFDQQTTTRLHLDGAPERSFLILGYEPTTVRSALHIADFSRCAHDMGLSSAEFLRLHNPMLGGSAALLEAYTTTMTDWHENLHRIVVVNNSVGEPGNPWTTHGVLHGATILTPDSQASRIINSTMIAPARFITGDPAMQVQEFVSTEKISGQILG